MTTTNKAIAAALTAVALLVFCTGQAQAQIPVTYTTVQSTVPAVVGYEYEPRGLFGWRGVYKPVVVPGATVSYVAPVAVSTPVTVATSAPVVQARVVVPPPVTYTMPVTYTTPVFVERPAVVVPPTPLPPVPSPVAPIPVVLPTNM